MYPVYSPMLVKICIKIISMIPSYKLSTFPNLSIELLFVVLSVINYWGPLLYYHYHSQLYRFGPYPSNILLVSIITNLSWCIIVRPSSSVDSSIIAKLQQLLFHSLPNNQPNQSHGWWASPADLLRQ